MTMERKKIDGLSFIKYSPRLLNTEKAVELSEALKAQMAGRRSVRTFSSAPIPKVLIENLIEIASSAPSGANKQPWTFCVVGNPELKKKIREAAEEEEYHNYHGRMNPEWIKELRPIGTNWQKPFLESAPYLIIVFKKPYDIDERGHKSQNYYVNESVGIACGFLIAAIHQAGLVSLSHTPSPMNFLTELLDRPENERAYLIVPVAWPHSDCWVPDIQRKRLEQVVKFYE